MLYNWTAPREERVTFIRSLYIYIIEGEIPWIERKVQN